MTYAVRLTVMCALSIAYMLVRGHHSIGETFGFACGMVLVGHGCAWIYAKHHTAGLVVAGVVTLGVLSGAGAYEAKKHPAPLTYREVDAVMADPASFVGDTMKVHGFIEIASIKSAVIDQQSIHTFVIHAKNKRLPARITGPVPDTFADRAEVVAVGRMTKTSDGYLLDATEVMAKCPSTYNTASGPQPASKFR